MNLSTPMEPKFLVYLLLLCANASLGKLVNVFDDAVAIPGSRVQFDCVSDRPDQVVKWYFLRHDKPSEYRPILIANEYDVDDTLGYSIDRRSRWNVTLIIQSSKVSNAGKYICEELNADKASGHLAIVEVSPRCQLMPLTNEGLMTTRYFMSLQCSFNITGKVPRGKLTWDGLSENNVDDFTGTGCKTTDRVSCFFLDRPRAENIIPTGSTPNVPPPRDDDDHHQSVTIIDRSKSVLLDKAYDHFRYSCSWTNWSAVNANKLTVEGRLGAENPECVVYEQDNVATNSNAELTIADAFAQWFLSGNWEPIALLSAGVALILLLILLTVTCAQNHRLRNKQAAEHCKKQNNEATVLTDGNENLYRRQKYSEYDEGYRYSSKSSWSTSSDMIGYLNVVDSDSLNRCLLTKPSPAYSGKEPEYLEPDSIYDSIESYDSCNGLVGKGPTRPLPKAPTTQVI